MNRACRQLLLPILCLAALAASPVRATCPPTKLWNAHYSGPGNANDEATSVAVNAGGDVYVAGWEDRTDLGEDTNWVVKRYNSAGTLLGSTSYNSPGNGIGNGNGTDTPDFVAIASDGDVVVVGSDTHNEPTRAALQGMDWLIMKYSPNLATVVWSRTHDSPAHDTDEATAVATSANAIYVVGYETRTDLGQEENWLVRKYDNAGELQWERTHNGSANSSDIAQCAVVDAGGNLVVVGYETATGQAGNWLVVKYDSSGNVLWQRNYNSPANSQDAANAVAIDTTAGGDGNIIVVGSEDRPDLFSGTNWKIIKYNSAGTALWNRNYGEGNGDRATCVAVDAAGYTYVGGIIDRGWLSQGLNWMVQKCDQSMNPVWISTYTSVGSADDGLMGLALDAANDVLLAGFEYRDAPKYEDWLVYKLAQPATCSGLPEQAVTVDHTPVTEGETMKLNLQVTNPGSAALTGLVPMRTYTTFSGAPTVNTTTSPRVLASLAAGSTTVFTWELTFKGDSNMQYQAWSEYDVDTGLKVCATFPAAAFRTVTLGYASRYYPAPAKTLDIRNNVIRIRQGTIAYGFIRKATAGAVVNLTLYSAAGIAVGTLPPVRLDASGSGTFSFDGTINGKALRTGVYQMAASGGLRDHTPIMVINE